MNKNKNSWKTHFSAFAGGAMLMAASAAGASEASADDWQYGFRIYGWLPGIDGQLKYPPEDGGVEVDASKILDALDMTFMGSFEARKGSWSGFTDVIYLKLSGDKSRSVPWPPENPTELANASMELKGWVWTLGGAYTVWRNQKSHLDLLAGARLLSLDTKVTLSGPITERNLAASVDLLDGIIGAKGQAWLNDRWFVPYYFDVGTGDTERTWQAMAGIGYEFDWGDVTLNYRQIGYDQGDEKLLQQLKFGGPEVGVIFKF